MIYAVTDQGGIVGGFGVGAEGGVKVQTSGAGAFLGERQRGGGVDTGGGIHERLRLGGGFVVEGDEKDVIGGTRRGLPSEVEGGIAAHDRQFLWRRERSFREANGA